MNRLDAWAIKQATVRCAPGLCWWLRNYRAEKGISRAQLAARMSMGVHRLALWENGNIKPGLDEITKWTQFLGARLLILDTHDGKFEVVIDADEFFMRPYYADEPHPLEAA